MRVCVWASMRVRGVLWVLLCTSWEADAFAVRGTGNAAYAATYGSAAKVDQAAYENADFWKQVKAEVPGFDDAPELARYRGWVANLITKPPGECKVLETGQEVLTQYVFPGLQDPATVKRVAFPSLPEVEEILREKVAPTAQAELVELLRARPLVEDDAPAAEGDGGESWNRCAWFGWQFISLRDAKPWMPGTIRALEKNGVPLAHRFIGIARQRADCRGTLHSDRRNYLLSTLTGLEVPAGCAVEVPGHGERVLRNGEVVVLDNTFKHVVYNEHPTKDRFVLMAEVWHPGLTEREREALGATFAVKDRFTLLNLRQCPWGFSEGELTRAIQSKDFLNLDFWRRASYGQ